MRQVSIAGLTILAALWAFAAPLNAQQPGPGRIVLLGARWCAPCMAELRNLAKLVDAAAPDVIVLAWVDRPIPVPANLAGKVETMPAEQARALAQSLGGEGYGLPMATVVSAGRKPCPPWRAPLRVADLAALGRLCGGEVTPKS